MMDREVVKNILSQASDLLEAGQPEQTLACLEKLANDPLSDSDDRIQFATLRAWALSELGRVLEALEQLEPVLEEFPDNARLHNTRGVVLSNADDLEEAREALDKAIELDDEDDSAWANYGLVLEKLRDFEAALDAYDHAANLGGDIAWLLQRMAVVQTELGDTNEGKRLIKRYLSLAPDDDQQWITLGVLYADDEQYDAAFTCFRSAEQIDPAAPRLRLHWGIAAVHAGQLAPARQQLAYLHRREPDSARTFLLRALIADAADELENAKRHMQRAQSRASAAAFDDLCLIYEVVMDFYARRKLVDLARGLFDAAYRANACTVEFCEAYREARGEKFAHGGWFSLLVEADYRPGLCEVYDHESAVTGRDGRFDRFQRNIQVVAVDPDDAISRVLRLMEEMGEKRIRICEIAAQEAVDDLFGGIYEIERESLVFRYE